jgi:hypothetical protein
MTTLVFDRGRSPASTHTPHHYHPSSIHCPEPRTPRNHFQQNTSDNSIAAAVGRAFWWSPPSKFPTYPPVQALQVVNTISPQPPPATVDATLFTSFLRQWLPPPCQSSCFFSIGPMLVFPGTNVILPIPLLRQTLPSYVHNCSHKTTRPDDTFNQGDVEISPLCSLPPSTPTMSNATMTTTMHDPVTIDRLLLECQDCLITTAFSMTLAALTAMIVFSPRPPPKPNPTLQFPCYYCDSSSWHLAFSPCGFTSVIYYDSN